MLRRVLIAVALAVLAGAVTACSIAVDTVQAVTIKNDTDQAVVLRICDSFGCDNLNDLIRPGQMLSENVNTSVDPYRIQVVNLAHHQLGCLEVQTRPLPSGPVVVSSMRPSASDCQ